ncbi:MAG: hypothetical protein ACFE0Q_16760 [Anaerolineae bacterium]
MSKRIAIFSILLIVAVAPMVVHADPVDGCYANASASTINEGDSVDITIECVNIPTANNVFGYQIGTTTTGDYDVTTFPTVYTAGTFSDASTGATSGVIVGANNLADLYAVTRQGSETATTTDFTLGAFSIDALSSLTTDGSIVVNMDDGDFILSNNVGQALTGWLRDVNDITITITNLDLAWLNSTMTVVSDVTTISNLPTVELVLGDKTYTQSPVASYTYTFTMDDTHQYSEVGSPSGDGVLSIDASANMTGHLSCSNTIDLGDSGSAIDVSTVVGTAGEIVLKAGDADDDDDIDNADATTIGANMGTNPADDKDINGDGTVNILDLVHVGRNFGSNSGTCGTGS